MRSLAQVLSENNRALLRVIREHQPESLSQLAQFSGRAPSNFVAYAQDDGALRFGGDATGAAGDGEGDAVRHAGGLRVEIKLIWRRVCSVFSVSGCVKNRP